MATSSHHTTLPLLLLLFLITLTLFRYSEAAGIAVYWGRNANEGSLADTCNTGNYQYVNIAYLLIFGDRRTPILNLSGHCNPSGGGCTSISNDIKTCQGRGIKVLLSISGPTLYDDLKRGYLSNNRQVEELAKYLWDNFLGGSSDSRPLGDAVLDGMDFDIQVDFLPSWTALAMNLSTIVSEKKVYLSTAPRCIILFDSAIRTFRFDFIWVKFYNDPSCDYSGFTVDIFLASWNQWASQPGGQIFMGLPADPAAAVTGFIPPDVLNSQVLPKIKASNKYGGVMLWNRFYDKNYSSAILPNI